MLLGMALLAMLDFAARTETDPPGTSVLYLALALALCAVYAAFINWDQLRPWWRMVPAGGAMLGVLGAVFWAESAATAHASIGFAAVAVLVLAYVGFVLPPGSALFFSPVVVFVLLGAHLREEFRVSRALPLVAVPVAALLGELVSALTDRTLRTANRFTSRKERLARLEDVLRRFSRPGSLEEAAYEVAEAALQIFDVERATVILRDNDGGLIPVMLGPSSSEELDSETADLISETIGGDDPKMVPNGTGTESMLVLPLPAADVPAGAVVVHPLITDDPDFSLDLARLFGTQVGIAIEHLFVIERLERATTRDELTGIGNRKHADALLGSLEEGDALILLDLDGFKEVNDTLGHAAGDQVLQDLSAHLRHCLRDSDTSARLGGDEFLIVARRAFADPLAVADRILIGWSTSGRSTTISAGVALHDSTINSEDTFERADQALYQAKAAGKNRAHMWYANSGTPEVAVPDLTSANGAAPEPHLDVVDYDLGDHGQGDTDGDIGSYDITDIVEFGDAVELEEADEIGSLLFTDKAAGNQIQFGELFRGETAEDELDGNGSDQGT
ncbi:MAG: GGDEF domain-containing protein [Actinomycetia bacterium]|nr:GGDEF domain-containing protein [Actinomycetes bacterium]